MQSDSNPGRLGGKHERYLCAYKNKNDASDAHDKFNFNDSESICSSQFLSN